MNPGTAFLRALVSYVFSLLTVYALALIINALAPTFASARNQVSALKLVAYSMTPFWVAGILNILPFLEWLSIIGFFYGLYVLYIGFETPMMETPKKDVLFYTLVSFGVIAILVAVSFLIKQAIFTIGLFYRPF